MGNCWSEILGEAIRTLASGETARARDVFRRLEAAVPSYEAGAASSLSSVWTPFLHLLHRRGYFVNPPSRTPAALEEIREMGPGFDLYDLAAAIADCDATLASHLCAGSSRIFPELRTFSASIREDRGVT